MPFVSSPVPYRWADFYKDLSERRVNYAGEAVSVRRELIAELVVPVWPAVGSACVCDILNFVDPHLVQDLKNPEACLLAPDLWPDVPKASKCYASDAEWWSQMMRRRWFSGQRAESAIATSAVC